MLPASRNRDIPTVFAGVRVYSIRAALVAVLLVFASLPSAAADPGGGPRPLCETRFADVGEWARSDANLDLYNGIAFLTAGGVLSEFGQPNVRWTAVNSFDDAARSALRLDTSSARRRADFASDVTLTTGIAVLPLASIGAHWFSTRDCVEAWDMATDFVESFGLSLLVSETLKLASGRSRPFRTDCRRSQPPSDAACGGNDRNRSFVSGHATLSATGAGVTCAYSLKRRAWGEGPMARAVPCGLGIGLALTTGLLRSSADRHWLTDVLGGMVVGGTIGWFDTWGPFDWLRFESRDAEGRIEKLGLLLPANIDGRAGFRFSLVY